MVYLKHLPYLGHACYVLQEICSPKKNTPTEEGRTVLPAPATLICACFLASWSA